VKYVQNTQTVQFTSVSPAHLVVLIVKKFLYFTKINLDTLSGKGRIPLCELVGTSWQPWVATSFQLVRLLECGPNRTPLWVTHYFATKQVKVSERGDWKCRTGKCGIEMQRWKMRDQAGMESQVRIVWRIVPVPRIRSCISVPLPVNNRLKRGLASSKVSLIRRLTLSEFTLMHLSKPKESILKTCYDVLSHNCQ